MRSISSSAIVYHLSCTFVQQRNTYLYLTVTRQNLKPILMLYRNPTAQKVSIPDLLTP